MQLPRFARLAATLLLAASTFLSFASAQQPAKKPEIKEPGQKVQEVPPREGKREVIDLFNGKDLTGWYGHTGKEGTKAYWSVVDGVIVGKNTDAIPVSTYLLTERKFTDFRLTFDFKLAQSEMHSGIAMWGKLAPEKGDPFTYAGHLVMFPSGYGFYDLYGRNMIHKNDAVAKPVGKQHDWNKMEILAQGNRIRYVLNGTLVSDWREPLPERIQESPIGLQLHSNKVPQEVQFKDIVVETFPEDKLRTVTEPAAPKSSATTTSTTIIATGKGIVTGSAVLPEGSIKFSGATDGGGTITITATVTAVAQAEQKPAKAEDNDRGFAEPLGVVPPCCVGLGDVKKFRVYFGTYTQKGKSEGIYRAELDLATGKLSEPVLAVATKSPSFLVVSPSRKFVYAVGESGGNDPKMKGGAVSAFSVDEKTGDLTFINEQSSVGGGPCHITIDNAGKNVLIANYGGGDCGVLPIKADGSLGEMSSHVQHTGEVADPKRQRTPHAHSINLDPANKFAFCADLGLDKVFIYKFDGEKGTITANDPAYGETAKVAGPRHFAIHPNAKYAYVINEINLTITAYAYDAAKGSLTEIQTISTLPEGVKAEPRFSTAEVQVHPSGKFVYGSNRTQNSIAAFKVDEATGKLTLVGHKSDGVNIPRAFGIDPTGKWFLCANQSGNDVIVYPIDQTTGALGEQVSKIAVFAPVCVKFVPIPGEKAAAK